MWVERPERLLVQMVAPKQVERAALEKALEPGSLARVGDAVDVSLRLEVQWPEPDGARVQEGGGWAKWTRRPRRWAQRRGYNWQGSSTWTAARLGPIPASTLPRGPLAHCAIVTRYPFPQYTGGCNKGPEITHRLSVNSTTSSRLSWRSTPMYTG
eukprot:scaffold27484_cov120-Isochrysis_galbana.AAC.8